MHYVAPLPKQVTCLIKLSYAPIFVMHLLQVSVNNVLNYREHKLGVTFRTLPVL